MFTIIENGEVYAPEPRGHQAVLLAHDKIVRIGNVDPGSVTDDLVLIDRVIGLGEIAISDTRSLEPTVEELAKLISKAYVGGELTGKAGVTHLHVGTGRRRLAILRDVLAAHEIPARQL